MMELHPPSIQMFPCSFHPWPNPINWHCSWGPTVFPGTIFAWHLHLSFFLVLGSWSCPSLFGSSILFEIIQVSCSCRSLEYWLLFFLYDSFVNVQFILFSSSMFNPFFWVPFGIFLLIFFVLDLECLHVLFRIKKSWWRIQKSCKMFLQQTSPRLFVYINDIVTTISD